MVNSVALPTGFGSIKADFIKGMVVDLCKTYEDAMLLRKSKIGNFTLKLTTQFVIIIHVRSKIRFRMFRRKQSVILVLSWIYKITMSTSSLVISLMLPEFTYTHATRRSLVIDFIWLILCTDRIRLLVWPSWHVGGSRLVMSVETQVYYYISCFKIRFAILTTAESYWLCNDF